MGMNFTRYKLLAEWLVQVLVALRLRREASPKKVLTNGSQDAKSTKA
jgi:hypothetical protein